MAFYNIIILILCISISVAVNGFPITNLEQDNANKYETRYPNGTVVGNYTYTDEEGNPIHVKYFADDASYGVELKSVKVVNADSDSLSTENLLKYPTQITEYPLEVSLDPFNGFEDLNIFNMTHKPEQLFKNFVKEFHKANVENNAEFEIFSQNELKAPEKCGKEKVKVYFDKDKRKIRNAPKHYDSLSICN